MTLAWLLHNIVILGQGKPRVEDKAANSGDLPFVFGSRQLGLPDAALHCPGRHARHREIRAMNSARNSEW